MIFQWLWLYFKSNILLIWDHCDINMENWVLGLSWHDLIAVLNVIGVWVFWERTIRRNLISSLKGICHFFSLFSLSLPKLWNLLCQHHNGFVFWFIDHITVIAFVQHLVIINVNSPNMAVQMLLFTKQYVANSAGSWKVVPLVHLHLWTFR